MKIQILMLVFGFVAVISAAPAPESFQEDLLQKEEDAAKEMIKEVEVADDDVENLIGKYLIPSKSDVESVVSDVKKLMAEDADILSTFNKQAALAGEEMLKNGEALALGHKE